MSIKGVTRQEFTLNRVSTLPPTGISGSQLRGKVIAFISLKGGVGKSSVLVNLADMLAGRVGGEDKVAIIDLDAQASSSIYLLGSEVLEGLGKQGRTAYGLLLSKLEGKDVSITDFIAKPSDRWNSRLYVVPGDSRILELERKFAGESGVWLIMLKGIVREIQSMGYRYVFIDTPASFGVLSRAALAACDYFLVPVVPDEFGLNALKLLTSDLLRVTINELKTACRSLGVELKEEELPLCGGVFFNLVDPRSVYHNNIMHKITSESLDVKLHSRYRVPVYRAVLYRRIAWSKAVEKHVPIAGLTGNDKDEKAITELESLYNEFYDYVINDKVKALQ